MSLRWMLLIFGLAVVCPLAPASAEEEPAEAAAAQDRAAPGGGEAPSTQDLVSVDYLRELRGVEERVQGLKERVFRAKATLQLLKELAGEGGAIGSRVEVWHINRLPRSYRIEAATYYIDGKSIRTLNEDALLEGGRELLVREAALTPGSHTLQVNLSVRGHGFRVFTYVDAYRFNVQSSFQFRAEDGRLTSLRAVHTTKGRQGHPFSERPNVRYEERIEQLRWE